MKVLWKSFRKWLVFRILVLLFMSWTIAGLILSGSPAILLFLFPVPVIFLITLFIVLRKLWQLLADQRKGQKDVLHVQVQDKTMFYKRGSTYCTIYTTAGKIKASKKLYDEIEPNESIKIAIAPKSKMIIGVLLSDGEFVTVY